MGRGAAGRQSLVVMGRGVWEGKGAEEVGLEILSAALIHWANRISVAFFLWYLLWASVTVFENLSFSSELGVFFLVLFFLFIQCV